MARANSSFDIDENGGPEIQKNMFVGNPDIHPSEQDMALYFSVENLFALNAPTKNRPRAE